MRLNIICFMLSIFVLFFSGFTQAADAKAERTKKKLVEQPWVLNRKTGLGKVTTVWFFLHNGTGTAVQKVSKSNSSYTESYTFRYELYEDRIVVRENLEGLDKKWGEYLGITRWTYKGNEIVADFKFWGKPVAFSALKY